MPAIRTLLVLAGWFALLSGGGESVCDAADSTAGATITNAAEVRGLSPDKAAQRLPVRLRGVATFVFDRHSCFIQDGSAGIFVGDGAELPNLTAGDLIEVDGASEAGEFAPSCARQR